LLDPLLPGFFSPVCPARFTRGRSVFFTGQLPLSRLPCPREFRADFPAPVPLPSASAPYQNSPPLRYSAQFTPPPFHRAATPQPHYRTFSFSLGPRSAESPLSEPSFKPFSRVCLGLPISSFSRPSIPRVFPGCLCVPPLRSVGFRSFPGRA